MARFNMFDFRQDLCRLTGRAFSDVTTDCAKIVRRRIARHNSLQEARCNRELTEREQNEEIGVERRLSEFFGPALAEFSGDPRGQTVKLKPWREPRNAMDAEPNPFRAAYVNEWGEENARLHYFEHDWGGYLVYTGGR